MAPRSLARRAAVLTAVAGALVIASTGAARQQAYRKGDPGLGGIYGSRLVQVATKSP